MIEIGSYGNETRDDLTITLRDSKNGPHSPVLEFTADEFAAFVAACKKGAYAYLTETTDDDETTEGVVQLLVPSGPTWEGMQNSLRRAGLKASGPIPLDEDPIPTYVLRPLSREEA